MENSGKSFHDVVGADSGFSHLVEAASALANMNNFSTRHKDETSSSDYNDAETMEAAVALAGGSASSSSTAYDPQNVVSDEEGRSASSTAMMPDDGCGEGGDVGCACRVDEDSLFLRNNSNVNVGGNSNNSKREIFPQRLMSILNDNTLADVITWLPHGRSFVIVRPDVFTEKVLPKYLPPVDARGATKYPSFTRKLNRWGFRQATRGPDTGAFHHPLFRRDQPGLCLEMVCQRSRGVEGKSKYGNMDHDSKQAPSSPVQTHNCGTSSSDGSNSSNGKCLVLPMTTSLPLKKRHPQQLSTGADTSDAKVAPLTKESLEAMHGGSEPLHTMKPCVAPSVVTDECRSDISGSNANTSMELTAYPPPGPGSVASESPSNQPNISSSSTIAVIPKGITNDKDFIETTLRKRDEMERLRIAKIMLHEAYMQALQQQGS